MKKKILSTMSLLTTLAIFTITGCGADDTAVVDITQEVIEATSSEQAEIDDAISSINPYEEAVIRFKNDAILPNGRDPEYQDSTKPLLYQNNYAVMDINEDGMDELLLSITEVCTADMALYIYSYDGEDFTCICAASPYDVTFYEGGVFTTKWLHGSLKQDDEHWPIDIYQYDNQTNTYELYGNVEPWQKSVAKTAPWSDEQYPEDIDTEGLGIVYKIGRGEDYAGPYCTQTEYEEFYNEILGGRNIVDIDWLSMSDL